VKPFRWGTGFYLLDDEKDLIALKDESDPDRLSAFIRYYFGYYLRKERITQPRSWGSMYYFPAESVARVVAILSVLLAAILLIGAIVTLYNVKPMGRRLGITGLYTVLFAASVGLLTNARRSEIFGATAA
jgi:hypothetical protein